MPLQDCLHKRWSGHASFTSIPNSFKCQDISFLVFTLKREWMSRLGSAGRGLKIPINTLQAGWGGKHSLSEQIPEHDPVRIILIEIF